MLQVSMGVDINAVRTLLRLNGLPPGSSDEEIKKALTAAHYTPEEIQAALVILKQPFPATMEAPVAAAPTEGTAPIAPVSAAPVFSSSMPIPPAPAVSTAVSPGIAGKILAPLLLLVLYVMLGLYATKLYTSLMFFVNGYKPEMLQSMLAGMSLYLIGGGVAMLVLLLIAWRVARMFYRTQGVFLWLLLLTATYTLLWFLIFFIGAPLILNNVKLEGDPDGLGRAILFGIGMTMVSLAFYACLALAVPFASVSWKQKRPRGKGIIAALVIALLAIGSMTYASGVLAYPAAYFHANFFCYGVPGKLTKQTCMAGAFSTESASQGEYEVVKVALGYPHGFQQIDGKLVFLASEGGSLGVSGVYVDGELVSTPGASVLQKPVDAGEGKIAYIETKKTEAGYKNILIVGGVEDMAYDAYSNLQSIDGELQYIGYKSKTPYLVRGGIVLAEGDGALAKSKAPMALSIGDTWGTGVVNGKNIVVTREKDPTPVSIDGKEVGQFPGRGQFFFTTSDGKHWVLTTKTGDKAADTATYVDGVLAPGVLRASETGGIIVYQKADGYYVGDTPLIQGANIWGPENIDGKLIMGAFGISADGKGTITYIIAEKGLLTDEVKVKLAVPEP